MSRAVALGWMYAAPRQFGSVIFEVPPIFFSQAFTPAAYPSTIWRACVPGPAFEASSFSTTLRSCRSVTSVSTWRLVPVIETWSSYVPGGPR